MTVIVSWPGLNNEVKRPLRQGRASTWIASTLERVWVSAVGVISRAQSMLVA